MKKTKKSSSFLVTKDSPFMEGKSEKERILISIVAILALGIQIAFVIMLMKFLSSFKI